MKNYAKSGIRKGKVAFRTPSRLRVKKVKNSNTVKSIKNSSKKYAASPN